MIRNTWYAYSIIALQLTSCTSYVILYKNMVEVTHCSISRWHMGSIFPSDTQMILSKAHELIKVETSFMLFHVSPHTSDNGLQGFKQWRKLDMTF